MNSLSSAHTLSARMRLRLVKDVLVVCKEA